jgi:hypothetical protein
VTASDEWDNPDSLAYQSHGESEPFLIDNTAPAIATLKVQGPAVVGKAADAAGPISKLEYSLDGIEWKLARADDMLLDQREEAFTVPFALLPHGNHTLVLRASDTRGNSGTRAIEINVP